MPRRNLRYTAGLVIACASFSISVAAINRARLGHREKPAVSRLQNGVQRGSVLRKALPYFRWFPSDAETDDTYLSMDDTQLGFYHHCLNLSWINDGLPEDPAARARVLRRNRNQADARWAGPVSTCFIPHPYRPGYLANTRQVEERLLAEQKSAKAAESVNHRYERMKNVALRAYEYDSVSGISSPEGGSGETAQLQLLPSAPPKNGNGNHPEWFEEWWSIYWRKVSRKPAEKAFRQQVKTPERFAEVMAATRKQTAAMLSRDPDHRPHGATWLNAERWKDEPSAPAKRNGHVSSAPVMPKREPTMEELIDAHRSLAQTDADPHVRQFSIDWLKQKGVAI